MRRSDVGVIVSAGLLLLSLLQPAAAQVKQGVLDKDTFMDMESVSQPRHLAGRLPDRLLARLGRQAEGPGAQQHLDRRHRRHAPARTDPRQLARLGAGVVARRGADRVPLGPRRHHADSRALRGDGRTRPADARRADARRPVLVARRQAARVHDVRARRGPRPARAAAEAAARRGVGEGRHHRRSPHVGPRRRGPGREGLHARLHPRRHRRAARRARSRTASSTTAAPSGRPTARRSSSRASASPTPSTCDNDSEIYAIDLASLAVTAADRSQGAGRQPDGVARRPVDRVHGLRRRSGSRATCRAST